MRIIDFLDSLNWTQTRLAQEAHVSTSTVQRLVGAKSISRLNAEKICTTLTNALGYTVSIHDINEMHVSDAERPQRRKAYRQAHDIPGLASSGPASQEQDGQG